MKKLLCPLSLFIIAISCFSQDIKVDTIIYNTKNKVISATYVDGYIYYLDKENEIYKIESPSNHVNIVKPDIDFDCLDNRKGKLVAKVFRYIPRKEDRYTEYMYNGTRFVKTGVYKHEENIRYEDEDFEITSTCSGEWGGTAYFKSKHNKKVYECAATCLLAVNKIDGSYYLTATLAHLAGSMEVIRVDNPLELEPAKKRNSKKLEESASRKGVVHVVDEYNVLALTSFVYENVLYHVIIKGFGITPPSTNLVTVKDGRFDIVHKLSDEIFWVNRPIINEKGWILEVSGDDTRNISLLSYVDGKMTIIKFDHE